MMLYHLILIDLQADWSEKLFDEVLKNHPAEWVNAGELRKETNDWDFSSEGRMRQATRMRAIADTGCAAEFIMICDFVCPTQELRAVFDADLCIWMNTITESQYADTNEIFEQPTIDEYDIEITEFDSDKWSETLADLIHMLVP